jgi:pilus assembly protein Flp/PilA
MFSFSSNNKTEKGQGLVEYAIILALVAIVVIASMSILGPKVSGTFARVNSALDFGGSPNWSQICVGNSGVTFHYHQTSGGNWSYGPIQIPQDTASYTCP